MAGTIPLKLGSSTEWLLSNSKVKGKSQGILENVLTEQKLKIQHIKISGFQLKQCLEGHL